MKLNWFGSRVFWGVMLILAGIMFMLDSLNVIQGGEIFWGALFTLVGALFLSTFVADRARWWALIPGVILFILGLMMILETVFPRFEDSLGGVVFLGGIGLAFWAVYLANRAHWWAIIPGGVLVTLAAVSGLESMLPKPVKTDGVFFIGLGVTFALVAMLPNPHGRMTWAYIPGFILGAMGLLFLASANALANYLWPAALILIGVVLLARTLARR